VIDRADRALVEAIKRREARKFCRVCGYKLDAERFCNFCGRTNPVIDRAVAPEPVRAQGDGPEEEV